MKTPLEIAKEALEAADEHWFDGAKSHSACCGCDMGDSGYSERKDKHDNNCHIAIAHDALAALDMPTELTCSADMSKNPEKINIKPWPTREEAIEWFRRQPHQSAQSFYDYLTSFAKPLAQISEEEIEKAARKFAPHSHHNPRFQRYFWKWFQVGARWALEKAAP